MHLFINRFKRNSYLYFNFIITLLLYVFLSIVTTSAAIMDFEDGSEGQTIKSTIPGMEFTTTAGYDWVYANKQYYNVYPNGQYYCNGNYFAWLGPNQGYGRIDFQEGTVSKVRTGYSSYSTVSLEAYSGDGTLLKKVTGGGNLNTYQLGYLEIEEPNIAYVFVHDSGNYWLIDDFEVTGEKVEILGIDAQEDLNETENNTSNFDDPFVIRRGQTKKANGNTSRFNVVVALSSNYDPDYYDVSFEATLKNWSGSVYRETFTIPAVTSLKKTDQWEAKRTELKEKSEYPFFSFDDYKAAFFEINIPYDAPIGKYEFKTILTPKNDTNKLDEESFNEDIVVVFNPWCPDDSVGDAALSEKEKQEYVNDDDGIVFQRRGWDLDTIALAWKYDQYNENVLNYVLDTIDNLPIDDLSDPAIVGRTLTLSLKASDDRDGTIFGWWGNNWVKAVLLGYGLDWNYPAYWSKYTPDVFSKYMNSYSKSKPVLFAQCFTYGGLVTSISRCIGIPTRPVTSFDAGDWNFHVWNESWLQRSDRPSYDGWQVFDGTYATGPAPVEAIKDDTGGDYDVTFMKTEVGSAIYTKEVDGDDPIDIVDSYGGPKAAFFNPVQSESLYASSSWYKRLTNFISSLLTPQAVVADSDDILINLGEPISVNAGEDLLWIVEVTNVTSQNILASLNADVHSIVYNGTDLGGFHSEENNLEIGPGQTISFNVTVSEDEYLPFLNSTNLFKLFITLNTDTEQWSAVGKGAVTNPSLFVELIPNQTIDLLEEVEVSWSFTNPMSASLNNIKVEIGGIDEFEILSGEEFLINSLEPGETISGSSIIKAKVPGQHPISVFLSCNELETLIASTKILIATPPQLFGSISGPNRSNIGETINLEITIANSGDYSGSGEVTIFPTDGISLNSEMTQTLGEIPAGEDDTIVFSLTLNEEGSYAIPFILEDSMGEVKHMIHYLSVYSYQHNLTIDTDTASVDGNYDSTVLLTISNDGNQNDSVKVNTYSSSSNLDFGLFDGTTKIVGEDVTVPAFGTKQLQLKINGTGYAGKIIVTASSNLDPDASDSVPISILGEEEPSTPVDLEVVLVDGKAQLSWQANPESFVISYIVFRKAPGEYAFTEYASSQCCFFEDIDTTVDGEYSYYLKAVTQNGLESDATDSKTITIQNKIPGDLDGDGNVDIDDINIIKAYANQPASANPDADIDGDGMITVMDARMLMMDCTLDRCARL